MSEVIGIRVPKKLKEELQELSVHPEEIRACLERIVKQKKLKKALQDADEFREKLQKKTGVMPSSADFIRWDREHGHS